MSRSDAAPANRKKRKKADDLPAALPSLWRTFRLGYRAEPRLRPRPSASPPDDAP